MALFDSSDSAMAERRSVQSRFFPDLNHRFMPAEGKAADAKYGRPGDVDPLVIDTMVRWAQAVSPPASNQPV
jgi:hypothetical protein